MDFGLAFKHSHDKLECFRGIETLDTILEDASLNEITILDIT